MTPLEADAQGFLVGERCDLSAINALLADIRAELRSLRNTLWGGLSLRNIRSDARKLPAPARLRRSADIQVADSAGTQTGRRLLAQAARRESLPPPLRNERGQFAGPSGDRSNAGSSALLRAEVNRLTDATRQIGSQLYETTRQSDPAIEALHEISGPFVSGFRTLFSSRFNDTVPWYKRIFRELRGLRHDQAQYSRAERLALEDLEHRQQAIGRQERGGSFSFTSGGGLLASLGWVLMSALGLIFSPVGIAITGLATAAWGLFTENGKKFFVNSGSRYFCESLFWASQPQQAAKT
jgi:hypothetical protein